MINNNYSQTIQNCNTTYSPPLPSSPIYQLASKIASIVTFDRFVEASIATLMIASGAIALTNQGTQMPLHGIAVALGSSVACTAWGAASIMKGQKTEGAIRLAVGTAFLGFLASVNANNAASELNSKINEDTSNTIDEALTCDSNSIMGKVKDIRLASVTDNYDIKGNINRDRQDITDLTVNNHKSYADRWNLKHDIVSKSIVANECFNAKTGLNENCSAYWNKVKYFVDWCKQPAESSDNEEWAIYADDDAVYTNFRINPSEAIDNLRSNCDTSFIISTEGPTTPYSESEGGEGRKSIKGPANSGVMIVRKDKNGCGIIEKTWERRNSASPSDMISRSDRTNCPTYGLCNDQSNGDEQGAIDKVLWGDVPHLVGSHVTRITPRDTSSATRAEIAFNTVHRGGCAQAFKNGELHYPWDISNGDIAHNKEGIWQKGDWIGQTAGFPMLGIYYPDQKIDCRIDPNKNIQPIRIAKVKEMLAAVES